MSATEAAPSAPPGYARLSAVLRSLMDERGWNYDQAAAATRDENGEEAVTRQQFWGFVREDRGRGVNGWAGKRAIEGLARAFDVPHASIYIPNAVSQGLDAPPNVAFLLPASFAKLPLDDQVAVRRVVQQLCDARGV